MKSLMTSPMKVVVIGTGFGGNLLAPMYRQLGCETQIVSPRDTDAIRQACAADVGLVSIHSPPFLHHDHVMIALDHKRPVLCDKPFGRNATEARAMRDRANAVGVVHFLNFEFRRQPSRVKLKQLLTEGAIGTLRHISWTFIGSGLRLQKHRWLFDASLAGGWIGAYGSHAIDTLRWLFESDVADCGGISRIETPIREDRDGVKHPSTAEDAFSAWFTMANGGTVSFDTAYSTPANHPNRMILLGSEGSLELVDELTLILRRPGAAAQTFEFAPPEGDSHGPSLVPWLGEVVAAVKEGHQIHPSFDDGVGAAEAMDRLRAGLIRVPVRQGGAA